MVKILCVEDEAMIRQMLVEELQDEGYDVIEAVDGQDGLEKILEHKPDIVISDISMPRMNGHELLKKIRSEFPRFAEMPFVFLTAFSNRTDMLHGLDLGADDYLTKPVDFDILLSKINSMMGQVQRIQDENRQKLEHIAYHDMLTGLPNRRLFDERLDISFQRIQEQGDFALLLLDLNRFKNINDTQGHLVGDMLLTEVAKRLMKCISPTDTLARMGGDEFAILQLLGEQAESPSTLSKKIHQALKSPFNLNGYRVHIDASIGIAIAPEDGSSKEELLGNADLALYRAKELEVGGNCRFDLELDTRLKARSMLEADLRQAVEKGEFELYYQPIYDMRSNAVVTFEALVRWKHSTRGLITPAEFIALAESTGLINRLGDWVLNRACAEATNWPDDISVAINLSPVQFRNDNLALLVAAALAKSGLSARRLELEVTESTLMENKHHIMESMHQLKSLGLALAMDDFGTGYSSLSYLRKYPFDKIKIDRSFMKDIIGQRDAIGIFRAIMGLAEALEMKTTAEGVETEEQLDLIRQEGCNFAQGYLFSRPVPVSEIESFFDLGDAEKVVRVA